MNATPDDKKPGTRFNVACLLLPVIVFVLLNPYRANGAIWGFFVPLLIACLTGMILLFGASRGLKQLGMSVFLGVLLMFACDAVLLGIYFWNAPLRGE